ncbi:outer membrane protein [Pontibaca salina]|uniref:Porin family protein n=1 Tax=Pontibaca salina TaxID=2795731 RepID=A0A934HTQ8_9RHOB|nr:porin family protein [Pontibaca salina]MBI6630053.1 porin family protein [Pontibaca salina]
MKPARYASSAIRNCLTAAGSVMAIACTLGGTAQAGNVEPVIVEPVVTAPANPNWEGFYLGGKVGYAFGGEDRVGFRDPSGTLVERSVGTLEYSGFNYGLRLGWRGQHNMAERAFVYGAELGYDRGNVKDSFSRGYSASVDTNHVLGLRLKSGFTNKSGNTLFYGILGYVRGDFDYAVNGTTGGDSIDLDTSFNTDGYSIGLGVEHMLNERWSVNAEWEYLEFDRRRLDDDSGDFTTATPKYNNLQLGVNFRF